jgi:hypothetical protein
LIAALLNIPVDPETVPVKLALVPDILYEFTGDKVSFVKDQ